MGGPDADSEPLLAIAPNDARVAYVHQHQVWLAEPQGRLRQLTFDGSADIPYGNAAHRAEFASRTVCSGARTAASSACRARTSATSPSTRIRT
jgi:hypothetical protein